ncbi:MAG: hypothetical protein O7F73_18265 [Gammaproteobacteria bacterium]|nr:hypothetical protein [Gammaproteobacteria bacterium]
MMKLNLDRRSLLKLGLGASALALTGTACSTRDKYDDPWERGDLQHMMPLVSHQAMNIKLSFNAARESVPLLRIGSRVVSGEQQDTAGRFWAFRVGQLSPDTEYWLQLIDQAGQALCDGWPLKTFPAPEQQTERLRVITYTCAGGPDLPVLPGNRDAFKPAAYRQKLFELMLAQEPDLVVANGDHVYWDYRSWTENRDSALGRAAMRLFLKVWGGAFAEDLPVLGTENEAVLTAIADEQIARIYGVAFRSTPVFFITDDHDYFENDDATPEIVTFPPSSFNRDLRQSLQRLYFPEFIVEETLQETFPGQFSAGGVNLSTHFGSLRYGDLFAGVLYDCGGQLNLQGDRAGLVPPAVESWLIENTRSEDTQHFAHFPSHPMGWTAGKWREWYPDMLESSGTTLAAVQRDAEGNKYLWQSGWWYQHQRLVQALSAQKRRKALVVSGDLHLLGAGRIDRSGDLDLRSNPVYTVLSGPVGVGGLGWLSTARGLTAATAKDVGIEEFMPPVERNGFTVLNLTRESCDVVLFSCPAGYVPPEHLTLSTAHRFQVV